MQGKEPIFAVTAIFGHVILTNLLKIQIYHFFLRSIYIIIRVQRAGGLLQENGGTPAIRREIPLRTKKPRPGFRAQAGLCPKIPKMRPKNRETRNRSRRAEAMRRAK